MSPGSYLILEMNLTAHSSQKRCRSRFGRHVRLKARMYAGDQNWMSAMAAQNVNRGNGAPVALKTWPIAIRFEQHWKRTTDVPSSRIAEVAHDQRLEVRTADEVREPNPQARPANASSYDFDSVFCMCLLSRLYLLILRLSQVKTRAAAFGQSCRATICLSSVGHEARLHDAWECRHCGHILRSSLACA